jgi:hypothetical protein
MDLARIFPTHFRIVKEFPNIALIELIPIQVSTTVQVRPRKEWAGLIITEKLRQDFE